MKKLIGVLACAIVLVVGIGCDKSTDPTSPNPAAVGTWEGALPDTSYTLIFNANGSVTGTPIDLLNAFAAMAGGSASASYTATEMTVTVKAPGAADEVTVSTYAVDGDTLTITDSDNGIEKWRRKK